MLQQELWDDGIRLEVDLADQIAVLTIDRPPVNTIDPSDERVLLGVIRNLGERRDVNAAVLTGAGTRAFCAGANLKNRRGRPDGGVELDAGEMWRSVKSALLQCRIPVIGAINGVAIGAGVGLASSCDVIFAADTARFGVTEINVGALGGGSALLRMVGTYKMRSLYYTGELAPAQELYRLGALEAVVPPEELMPVALAFARKLAAKSPIGMRLAKESLNRMELSVTDYEAAYRMEQDYTNRLRQFEDSKEGSAAFNEKRAPQWKWR